MTMKVLAGIVVTVFSALVMLFILQEGSLLAHIMAVLWTAVYIGSIVVLIVVD